MDMVDHRARLIGQWLGTLAALLAMAPAWAQESLSVKELLDRAQTKPQTEAVEDLIRKLKRASEANEPPRPPPSTAKAEPPATEISTPLATQPPPIAAVELPPEEGRTEPAKLPETSIPQAAVSLSPGPPAAPVETAAPAPVAVSPPSVDLEVHFNYKSVTITPQAVDVLTVLGRALSDKRLSGQIFLIAGHTDAKGGAAYNLKLSQGRAEAVRKFLIKHFSVQPNTLIAEGYGYRQLKNASMPFAEENRRVQVTNITQQTQGP
jgi:outer membrane protein OmpA-like peptidoglycan-associated protein